MAVVSKLLVDIAADTSKLVSGMDRATKKISSFGKSVTKVAKIAGTAIAGITGGSAFNSMLKDISSLGASIDANAKVLGSSVTYYQQMGKVFEDVGSNANTFTDGVKQLNKALGDIAQGGGSETKKVLENLGLDAAALSMMSLEERTNKTLQAISNLSSETLRASANAKLFGEFTGRIFTGLMNDAESLQSKLKDALRFVIPEDTINGLTRLGKSFNDVKSSFDILKSTIAGSGIGALYNEMLKGITDVILKSKEFRTALDNTAATMVGWWNVLKSILSAAGDGWAVLGLQIGKFVVKSAELAEQFKQAWYNALSWVIDKTIDFGMKLSDSLSGSMIPGMDEVSKSALSMVNGLLQYRDELEITASKNTQSLQNTQQELKILDNQIQILGKNAKDSLDLQEVFNKNFDETKEMIDGYRASTTAVKELSQEIDKLPEKTKKAAKASKTLQDQWSGVRSAIGSGFDSLFQGLMDGSTSWGDVMLNIIKRITAELINMLVIKQMVSAISGFFGIGSVSTSSGPSIQAFAKGGIVNQPTFFTQGGNLSVAGEAGTEAILPLTRVNGDLGVKATVPEMKVEINNYTNDNVEVSQDGDTLQITIAAIANDVYRGTGPIPQALESRYGLLKR
jgi:methyl-accepting chemotaxis protein